MYADIRDFRTGHVSVEEFRRPEDVVFTDGGALIIQFPKSRLVFPAGTFGAISIIFDEDE